MVKHLRIILSLSLVISTVLFFSYSVVEPLSVRAVTVSDQVRITLTVDTGITIDSPSDSNMSTDLGVAQNTAVGTTTWTVKTNDVAGYSMEVRASTNPAMQQSSTTTILDYQTNGPNPWVATSGSAYFGYSAFGTDTATSGTNNWGTDTDCSGASANAISTTLKYKGFTTSAGTPNIASRTSTTTPSGVATTVCYAVEQNGYYVPSGQYNAFITATATTN